MYIFKKELYVNNSSRAEPSFSINYGNNKAKLLPKIGPFVSANRVVEPVAFKVAATIGSRYNNRKYFEM